MKSDLFSDDAVLDVLVAASKSADRIDEIVGALSPDQEAKVIKTLMIFWAAVETKRHGPPAPFWLRRAQDVMRAVTPTVAGPNRRSHREEPG